MIQWEKKSESRAKWLLRELKKAGKTEREKRWIIHNDIHFIYLFCITVGVKEKIDEKA